VKSTLLISVALLCLELLAGCGATRPDKYYQLSLPGDRGPANDPTAYPVTLIIGPILSPQLYQDQQIVYSSQAQAMGAYQYHRWAEPPAEMIGDVLLRELLVSGRYRSVISLNSRARGDYLLRGRLYDFREVDGSPLIARVAFAFELRDSKTDTIVWKQYYSHDEPVNGKDVTAVVAAMNRNVLSGLSEITGGLAQYFAGQEPPAASAR